MVDPEGLHREGALRLPLHAPHVAAVRGHHAARAMLQPPEVDQGEQVHQHPAPFMAVDDLTELCTLLHPGDNRMLQVQHRISGLAVQSRLGEAAR